MQTPGMFPVNRQVNLDLLLSFLSTVIQEIHDVPIKVNITFTGAASPLFDNNPKGNRGVGSWAVFFVQR